MNKAQSLSNFPSYIDLKQDVEDILASKIIPEFLQDKDNLAKMPGFLDEINADFDKHKDLERSFREYKTLSSECFENLLKTFNQLVQEVDEFHWDDFTKEDEINDKEVKK